MTYNQYQLLGAIEQTRFSSLQLQEVARRSPGAAISAMQVLTAMKRGTLIPFERQKGEIPKSFPELFRASRGGLVFQPTPGIFKNVAILDFSSKMASIMIKYNVSPETVVAIEAEGDGFEIPKLGVKILSRPGLVPEALKPMRDKRLALKKLLKSMDKNDPRYRTSRRQYSVLTWLTSKQAVSDSLKWLTVVCYGRLGFANSIFGRLNSHEVVSYLSRKMITEAKFIAEENGFDVHHLYVDSLFVSRPDATREDFQALVNAIEEKTELPMELENVYSWFAFLSSRQNPNISVANRFYGIAANGEHKIRGVALRRGDTCKFVANLQRGVLEILAKEADPAKLIYLLPEVLAFVQDRFDVLKRREVPFQELVVSQDLSRELDQFSVLCPLACASKQLQAIGKTPKRGQQIQFLYMGPAPGVHAWSLPKQPEPRTIDVRLYRELGFRAVYEVLQPLGITERVLKEWVFNKAGYVIPVDLIKPVRRLVKQETPIFADTPYLRLTNF
jgi:DNA polymerase II